MGAVGSSSTAEHVAGIRQRDVSSLKAKARDTKSKAALRSRSFNNNIQNLDSILFVIFVYLLPLI